MSDDHRPPGSAFAAGDDRREYNVYISGAWNSAKLVNGQIVRLTMRRGGGD